MITFASESAPDFPTRLRMLRENADLSQAKLAELAEIHVTMIGRYERGTSSPTTESLFALSDALGVSADHLLDGSAVANAEELIQSETLLNQFLELQQLSREDQQVIETLIGAFLIKRKMEQMFDEN